MAKQSKRARKKHDYKPPIIDDFPSGRTTAEVRSLFDLMTSASTTGIVNRYRQSQIF